MLYVFALLRTKTPFPIPTKIFAGDLSVPVRALFHKNEDFLPSPKIRVHTDPELSFHIPVSAPTSELLHLLLFYPDSKAIVRKKGVYLSFKLTHTPTQLYTFFSIEISFYFIINFSVCSIQHWKF